MPSVSKLNKVKQVQHDNTERKRLKDAKPKVDSPREHVRGNERKQTWRLKDAKPKVDSPREHVRGNEREQTWRLKDAKPKANSRGLLSPWKQKRRIEMASAKTRNGNVSGDLKVPRY